MLDAVIIGAGPAGSWTACRLAGIGYQVAVLEKRAGTGEKPCCTGIVSRECISAYAIEPGVIFRQANSAKIVAPSGEFIRLYRQETQAGIINRPAFDRWLAGKAQSRGADYHFQAEAKGISFRTDKAVVEVEENGRDRQIEAQAVILATGFSAHLVRKLGLGQPGYPVAGVQAEVEIGGLDEVEIYFNQQLAPGFFAWLVPTAGGRGLAGLLTRHSPGLHLREWVARLRAQGRIVQNSLQIHYGGIPLKPLAKTSGERLLVVGDAAGQVKPTTGGGIYFGLICADIAAETLHQAFQAGDLSAGRMSRYDQGWRKKIGSELRREYLARRLYEHLSDRQIEGLFARLKSSGMIDSLLKEDSLSFDWHGGLMTKVLKAGTVSQVSRLWPFQRREG